MNYEKFIKICRDAGAGHINLHGHSQDYFGAKKGRVEETHLCFSAQWRTRGASGGSCWGDDAEEFESDSEEDLKDLDLMLEVDFPSISFLQYKKISGYIDTIFDWQHNTEYYGNYSVYALKYIKVEDLFILFKELGLCE